MKIVLRHAARIGALAVASVLIGTSASAAGRGFGRAGGPIVPPGGNRIVYGERQTVNGVSAYTWARVNVQGKVQEVGVSIPGPLIWSPSEGAGPLGAFLSLDFPDVVRATTYLNHYEMHWNPEGHPPAIFGVPHFDFHFYSIPESAVWNIMPPDTRVPDANQIPAGYVFPGVGDAVPMMGTHAVDPAVFSQPFTATMIAGFWHGDMIFVEPMVTREYLIEHPNFALSVPRPQYLYRETEFPAVIRSHYNARTRTYEITLSGFSTIHTPPED